MKEAGHRTDDKASMIGGFDQIHFFIELHFPISPRVGHW